MELFQKITKKLNTRKIATILSLVLPMVIVFACFQMAQKIEPGKILPSEFTQRFNLLDNDILSQVDEAVSDSVSDSEALKSGNQLIRSNAYQNIIMDNTDPFFLISLLLPVAARHIWFMFSFFFKFGLLGLTMYWLLRRHININSSYALVLSTGWAVSPMFLCLGQISSLINMAIILPMVISAMDGYLRSRKLKNYIFITASVVILMATGIPALFFGSIFVIYASFFLSIGLFRQWKKMLSSWGLTITAGVLGMLFSAVLWIPRAFLIDNNINFEYLFDDGEMKYTLLDQLLKLIPVQALSLGNTYAPYITFGIFGIILLFIFFMNSNIPARLKTTLFSLVIVIHILNSYTPLNTLTGTGNNYPVVLYARTIPLICLLIFAAGVSLKNIEGISAYTVYGSAFWMIAILIFSNSSKLDLGSGFISLYLSGLMVVLSATFLVSATRKATKKNRISCLIVFFVLYFISSFLTLSKTTISTKDLEYYNVTKLEQTAIDYDTDDSFSIFTTEDTDISFIVTSTDLEFQENTDLLPDIINNISECAGIGKIFSTKDSSEVSMYGFTREESGEYKTDGGFNEIILGIDKAEDEIIYVYSDFDGEMYYDLLRDEESLSAVYLNPFLYKVDDEGYLENRIEVTGGSDITGSFLIYSVDINNLSKLNEATKSFDGSKAVVKADQMPGNEGVKTIVTSLPYKLGLSANINGKNIEAFNYNGKAAFTFEWLQGDTSISVNSSLIGISSGLTLSFTSILGTVAIIVLTKYNKKRNSNVRGAADAKCKNS